MHLWGHEVGTELQGRESPEGVWVCARGHTHVSVHVGVGVSV